ncbi:MAG: c-type cytochrome domain-containing protein [Planctomycetota bacterium]
MDTKSYCFKFLILTMGCWLLIAQESMGDIDFVKEIKPIFENHCLSCHGTKRAEGLRLDSKLEASDYLVPGEPEESDIYLLLIDTDEDYVMPPPNEGIRPLSKQQIATVKQWIKEGAQWPDGVTDWKDRTRDPIATVAIKAPNAVGNLAEVQPHEGMGKTSTEFDEPLEKPAKKPVDSVKQVQNAIGSLHPAAIHLPLGLILAAGLFAFLSLRGNFVMSDCAYYCLWIGALTAIGGCLTGWYFSPMEKRGTVEVWSDLLDQDHKVFWHRTGAIVITFASLILALFARNSRRKNPDDGLLWKLGLMVLAAGIGWVGHTGGKLHYPSDHYEDLNALYERVTGLETDGTEEPDSH